MAKLAALLVCAFALSACGAPSGSAILPTPLSPAPPPARVVLDAGLRTAAAEHKNVLVVFGASWCVPCRLFEAMLADSPVGSIFRAHYVIVSIVTAETPEKQALENPGSEGMMARMGGAAGGVPYFVALDPAGRQLADSNLMPNGSNIGYPQSRDEARMFDWFLVRTAPGITRQERTLISAYLGT